MSDQCDSRSRRRRQRLLALPERSFRSPGCAWAGRRRRGITPRLGLDDHPARRSLPRRRPRRQIDAYDRRRNEAAHAPQRDPERWGKALSTAGPRTRRGNMPSRCAPISARSCAARVFASTDRTPWNPGSEGLLSGAKAGNGRRSYADRAPLARRHRERVFAAIEEGLHDVSAISGVSEERLGGRGWPHATSFARNADAKAGSTVLANMITGRKSIYAADDLRLGLVGRFVQPDALFDHGCIDATRENGVDLSLPGADGFDRGEECPKRHVVFGQQDGGREIAGRAVRIDVAQPLASKYPSRCGHCWCAARSARW